MVTRRSDRCQTGGHDGNRPS